MKGKSCELCQQEAFLFCGSDSAFLCWKCDALVHQANFLVARHFRDVLCYQCKGFSGEVTSGPQVPHVLPLCAYCSPEECSDEEDAVSVSSTESSAATMTTMFQSENRCSTEDKVTSSSYATETSLEKSSSPAKSIVRVGRGRSRRRCIGWHASTTVDVKVKGIVENWCQKLGLDGKFISPAATHAFNLCLANLKALRFRVALATSFWLSLRFYGDSSVGTWQNLRRLEDASGVPAKLILAVEEKLMCALRYRRSRHHLLEEGSAECSA